MSKLLLKNKNKLLRNFLVKGVLLGVLAGSAHLLTLHFIKRKLRS